MNVLKTFKNLESDKQRNLLILFFTALLFWTSITTLLPTLPIYIEDLGGTKQQIGLVMGSFAIGLIGTRTYVGKLADERGRKLVVLIGTVVAALAPLGYLLLAQLHLLMLVRAFHGISIAAFTTGFSALVTDLSPVKQRGEIIGYMTLAVPIGMSLGPAIGGTLQESVGYMPLFLFSCGSGVLSYWLANLVRENPVESQFLKNVDGQMPPQRNFREIFQGPALLVPTIVLLLVGMLFGTLVTFLPLFMRQSELKLTLAPDWMITFHAGFFYAIAAIASFAVRVFIGQASDRYGRGVFITASLICYALSMLFLAFGNDPVAVILAAIFEGAAGGVLIPMVLALLSDRSYPHERGRVFAICTGGFDVGTAMAALLLSFLPWGYQGMFALAGWFAVIALVLFFSRSNKNLTHSLGFAFGRDRDRYSLD